MSTFDDYKPSLEPQVPIQIDKAAAQAKYRALCSIRDDVNKRAEPLLAEREKEANAAEVHRVKAEQLNAKIAEIRGGNAKWRGLKREIGVLAKVTTGVVPPTEQDLALAAQILGSK